MGKSVDLKQLTKDISKRVNQGAAQSTNKTWGILNEESSSQDMSSEVNIYDIPRENIIPDPKNEIIYDVKDLEALALDIANRGIQNPLIVYPTKDHNKFMILSGHRRKAANDEAVDKFGYKKGEKLPCIIKRANGEMQSDEEMTIELMLNNLQRMKSDFERMMEIVTMRKCLTASGVTATDSRNEVAAKLGVSKTEITRSEKVYKSLIEELLARFRKGELAATVAYEIAKQSPEFQHYLDDQIKAKEAEAVSDAVDSEETDHVYKISLAIYEKTLKDYNRIKRAEESHADEQPESVKDTGKTTKVEKPENVSQGVEMLDKVFASVRETLTSETLCKADQKATKKILKKIQKQMTALISLENDLVSMMEKAKEETDGK